MSVLMNLVLAAGGIGGTPDPNGLPGSPALQQLDQRSRLLGSARRARRPHHLGSRVGAQRPLRQLPPRRPSAGAGRSSPPPPRSSSALRRRSSPSSRTSATRSSSDRPPRVDVPRVARARPGRRLALALRRALVGLGDRDRQPYRHAAATNTSTDDCHRGRAEPRHIDADAADRLDADTRAVRSLPQPRRQRARRRRRCSTRPGSAPSSTGSRRRKRAPALSALTSRQRRRCARSSALDTVPAPVVMLRASRSAIASSSYSADERGDRDLARRHRRQRRHRRAAAVVANRDGHARLGARRLEGRSFASAPGPTPPLPATATPSRRRSVRRRSRASRSSRSADAVNAARSARDAPRSPLSLVDDAARRRRSTPPARARSAGPEPVRPARRRHRLRRRRRRRRQRRRRRPATSSCAASPPGSPTPRSGSPARSAG